VLRRLLLGLCERIDEWFDVDLGELDEDPGLTLCRCGRAVPCRHCPVTT